MTLKMIHRKESLIITAVALLDEKGFQGLSTRELANREGVSEATIFKHFKTKNELMLAVLDHYSQFDEALVEVAFRKRVTPKERILVLFQGILSYYENYPEITAVLQAYGALVNEVDLKGKVIEIFFIHRRKTLKTLVDDAIGLGEINPSTDSEILTDIILGTIDGIILKWRLQNYQFPLKEHTLAAITRILDSFSS